MTSDKSDSDQVESQNPHDPLYEKLQKDIDESDWSLLQPHYERQAIFILSEEIDIAAAGVAMAQDNVETVKSWMENQKLSQPKKEDAEAWGNDLQQRFKFLIIQPYVLVQLMRSEQ